MTRDRTFSYTAERGLYFSIAGALLSIILLEGVALDVLIALLVQREIVKVLLLGLITLLHLTVLALLSAPLWTKHQLTPTHLHIRYGIDRMTVPRAAIVAARPVREALGPFAPFRAQHDPERTRVTATFSESGQVWLEFEPPQGFGRSEARVSHLLINVDHRDAFLTALGVPIR